MNQILCLTVHSRGQKFKIAILFGIAGTCQICTHAHTPYCKIYDHSSSTDGNRYCIQPIPGMWTHCPPLYLIIMRGKSILQTYNISHYHLCRSDFAFHHLPASITVQYRYLRGPKTSHTEPSQREGSPGVFVQSERNFIIHPLFYDIISFLTP